MDNQEVYYNKYINYKLKYLRLKKEAENNSLYDDEINYLEGLMEGGETKKDENVVDYTKKINEAIVKGKALVDTYNKTYITTDIKEEMLKDFNKIKDDISKNESKELKETQKLFEEAIKSYKDTVNKDLGNLEDKKKKLRQKMLQRQKEDAEEQKKVAAEIKAEEEALIKRNTEIEEKIKKKTEELKLKLAGLDAAELEADKTELSVLINNFNAKLIEYKQKASNERLLVIGKIRQLAEDEEIGEQLKKNSKYKTLTKNLYDPKNLEMPDSFKNIEKQLKSVMDMFDPSLPNVGLSPKEINDLVKDKKLLDDLKKQREDEEKVLKAELEKLQDLEKKAKGRSKKKNAKQALEEFQKKMEEKQKAYDTEVEKANKKIEGHLSKTNK